jgi:mono/diheme cytochrome c family protein
MRDQKFLRRVTHLLMGLVLAASTSVFAQSPIDSDSEGVGGRELVLKKCAQCHTDSIWRDHRQDERAWEATLYRMMGRGAIWTKEEIKSMALFLGSDFGPQSTKVKSN